MLRSVTTLKTIAQWTLMYRTGETAVTVRLLQVWRVCMGARVSASGQAVPVMSRLS